MSDPVKIALEETQQTSQIKTVKGALRKRIKELLQKVPPEERLLASAKIQERIEANQCWVAARNVLFYAALSDEIGLNGLMLSAHQQGKKVALPRYVPTSGHYEAALVSGPEAGLTKGQFGIMEPREDSVIIPMNQLDFVLVPGVAFDSSGRRLGRGKGFYDRLLLEVQGLKCGICLDAQIVEHIPTEPHDILLNCIITPTHSFDFNCDRV